MAMITEEASPIANGIPAARNLSPIGIMRLDIRCGLKVSFKNEFQMPIQGSFIVLADTVKNDDQFFNHAGNYLRERASTHVVGMIATRFRNNSASGNMWNALRGLSKVNTPESNALLHEIATTATRGQVKQQAQRYIDEQKRMLEAVAGSED